MDFPIEIAVAVLILVFVVTYAYLTLKTVKYTIVKIGNATVKAEIADTPLKKMRGLMFRKSLAANDGMIFPFDSEGYQGFWMMNTSIPLDLIWLNSTKHIVFIQKDAQPCTITDCPVYKPDSPAMYVLETNAGFTDAHEHRDFFGIEHTNHRRLFRFFSYGIEQFDR